MKVFNKLLVAIFVIVSINFYSNIFAMQQNISQNSRFFAEHEEKALQDQAANFSSKIFGYLKTTEYLSDTEISINTQILSFLDSNSNNLKKLFHDSFYCYMTQLGQFKKFKSDITKITENAKNLKISTYNYFVNFIKRLRDFNLVNIFEQSLQTKKQIQDRFENIAHECLTVLHQEINRSWFSRTKERFSWRKKKVEPQTKEPITQASEQSVQLDAQHIQSVSSSSQEISGLSTSLNPIEICSESELLENSIKKNIGNLNHRFENVPTIDSQVFSANAISYQEFFGQHNSLVKKLEDGVKPKIQKPGFLRKIKSIFTRKKAQDTEVILKNLLLKHLHDLKLRFLNYRNTLKDGEQPTDLTKKDFEDLDSLISRYIQVLNEDEVGGAPKKAVLTNLQKNSISENVAATATTNKSKTIRALSALIKLPFLATKVPLFVAKKGLSGTTYLFDRFIAKTKIGRLAMLFVVLLTIEACCKFKKIDLNLSGCVLDKTNFPAGRLAKIKNIFGGYKNQISCRAHNAATVARTFKDQFVEEVSNPGFENVLNFIKRIILRFVGERPTDNLNLSSNNGFALNSAPDENCGMICKFLVWMKGKDKEVDLNTQHSDTGFFDKFYKIGILYALFNLV
ncbi:hypothetical protein K9M16_04580 [Candidatus Babeliales bacterium]|nr:hypothetical protein [Candidatus Babeliales bacterium]